MSAADRPPRLIPDPDGLNAEFYRRLAGGRIHFQRCAGCQKLHHPPRYRCSSCGSEAHTWSPASGRGAVFSWTVTHRAFDPGWAHEIPYATLVVEMDEGLRLVGALRDWPASKLTLGLPVAAEVEPLSDRFGLIHFRVVPDP